MKNLRRIVLLAAAIGLAVVGLAAPAGARASGTEHLVALTNNPNAHVLTLVGKGPIHAAGKDVQLSSTKDRFKFPNGSLLIKHKPKKHHQTMDKKTCLFTFTEHGTYKVVSGTGAYKNASGHGHYVASVIGVGCSQSKPPNPFQQKIVATGPLSTT